MILFRLKKHQFLLILIIVVGFFLRVYQLGKDSFWLDETGVASVIFVNSVSEFVNIVRSHVAAVPLDYVITWIIGQFTLNEGWLRLPSAIWGTATLMISYPLFNKLTNERTALAGVICLSFSPLLIKYSQELRFYSSLIFFYILSTKLLLDAFQSNENKDWAIYTVVTIIGGYFHIFVGFSLVNGFFWYFQFWKKESSDTLRKFTLSVILVFIGSLSAYYLFAGYNSRLSETITKIEPIWQAIGIGLGWIPITYANNLSLYVWGMTCLLLEIIGILGLLRNQKKSLLRMLIISIVIQICAILFLLIIRGYFLQSRHLIFLHPLLILICVNGCFFIREKIKSSKKFGYLQKSLINFNYFIFLFCFLSIPILLKYYQEDKGNARETAIFLSEVWEPGDLLFFFPYNYSAEPVKYYLVNVMGYENILPYLWTTDLKNDNFFIENADNGINYLVGKPSSEQENFFIQNGFRQSELVNVWFR